MFEAMRREVLHKTVKKPINPPCGRVCRPGSTERTPHEQRHGSSRRRQLGRLQPDCVKFAQSLPDNSIDLSVYSPPFSSLYVYGESVADMGNVASDAEFIAQYRYLVREIPHHAPRATDGAARQGSGVLPKCKRRRIERPAPVLRPVHTPALWKKVGRFIAASPSSATRYWSAPKPMRMACCGRPSKDASFLPRRHA